MFVKHIYARTKSRKHYNMVLVYCFSQSGQQCQCNKWPRLGKVTGQVRAKAWPCCAKVKGQIMPKICACTNPLLDDHGHQIWEACYRYFQRKWSTQELHIEGHWSEVKGQMRAKNMSMHNHSHKWSCSPYMRSMLFTLSDKWSGQGWHDFCCQIHWAMVKGHKKYTYSQVPHQIIIAT